MQCLCQNKVPIFRRKLCIAAHIIMRLHKNCAGIAFDMQIRVSVDETAASDEFSEYGVRRNIVLCQIIEEIQEIE